MLGHDPLVVSTMMAPMRNTVRGDTPGRRRGAVLVTGASTGIGRATALHLAALGFEVFAGVRRDADGERIATDASGSLTPVILDVRDTATIDAAAQRVPDAIGDAGLRGLVNNAGIAQPSPIEIMPIDALREQLEVNVVGQVAVSQAFLPLIRRARGRVVNISSVGGRVSSPALGAYAASKFAIEAISDAMRMELHQWGIHVAVIEPGSFGTEIWRRGGEAADSTLEQTPEENRALYAGLIAAVRKLARRTEDRGKPPDAVVRAIVHALTASRPRTRYVVGTDARIQIALARLLPDRAYDAVVRRMLRIE
jgi:NAD(P)-dependent dehydrogenase (short-subunit alcohol dehydrogenase family)